MSSNRWIIDVTPNRYSTPEVRQDVTAFLWPSVVLSIRMVLHRRGQAARRAHPGGC